MQRYINIKGNDQSFPYLIEYNENYSYNFLNDNELMWRNDLGTIRFYNDNIKYYRDINDWYKYNDINTFKFETTYIPTYIKMSKIKVYIPSHSISSYENGINYVLNCNTWISGKKVDLGSFLFKPTDTFAPIREIKQGNNEYYECIEFDIIDPFYLLYSDDSDSDSRNDWVEFRKNVCNEDLYTNTNCSQLNISLHIIKEFEDKYILNNNWLGGYTSFDVSHIDDHLSLSIQLNNEPLGIGFGFNFNEIYKDDLLGYLQETYYALKKLPFDTKDIYLELVIKNKDSIIIGPRMSYNSSSNVFNNLFNVYQIMEYEKFIKNQDIDNGIDRSGIKVFFKNWNVFEEGWSFSGSLVIYDEYENEIFNITSNEIPITQEIFSKFVNDSYEQIIDIEKDMNIVTYNIVNKIENNIVKLDRQKDSKNNIIQPVFFRTVDAENLIIHPNFNENISINLDPYKSKVKKFILQINDFYFEQIGSNSYGILFKIPAKKVSNGAGIYYILNENFELVTVGKYTCII